MISICSAVFVSAWGIIYFLNTNKFTNLEEFATKARKMAVGLAASPYLYLFYSIVAILVMLIWVKALKTKGTVSITFSLKGLKGLGIPILLALAFGLQIVTNYLMNFCIILMPDAGNSYIELMKTAGLSGNVSPLMLIYAILLGPVLEELTYRGLSYKYAREAFGFWAANTIQAVFFGLAHMNLIQGIYAFALGMVLGYIYSLTGNLFTTMVLHIFFNLLSGVGESLTSIFSKNPLSLGLSLLLALCLVYVMLMSYKKSTSR
jgi:membrane protease YdiL (CAAX protease family)